MIEREIWGEKEREEIKRILVGVVRFTSITSNLNLSQQSERDL